MSGDTYRASLFRTFWTYRRAAFAADADIFEPRHVEGHGPPVFRKAHANRNIIVPPEAPPAAINAVVAMIARADRHRWFASMRSSQALAQSVFGGLAALGRLEVLEHLAAEDGAPAFFESSAGYSVTLEHKLATLGEPSPTSVDAFFRGPRRIAVEVKLAEEEFSRCSRPQLTPDKPNYARDHCDGSFSIQRSRKARCSLSDIGVRYWEFVPQLFGWKAEVDHRPCPLAPTYQVVRNVLAACLGDDATLDTGLGHALVVYDRRNPAFQSGGAADAQFRAAQAALGDPRLLRRVSWQVLAFYIGQFRDLDWLIQALADKFGICGAAL